MPYENQHIEDILESEINENTELTNSVPIDETNTDTTFYEEVLEKYEINKTEEEFLRWKMKQPEISNRDLARILRVGENHVSRIKNKPVIQQIMKQWNMKWWEKLEEGKKIAMDNMISFAKVKDRKIRMEASKFLLTLDNPHEIVTRKEFSNIPPSETPAQ